LIIATAAVAPRTSATASAILVSVDIVVTLFRDERICSPAIKFAQMKRKVTLVQFTTTCSTRCKVSTHGNDGLRAANEVAPGSKAGRIDNKAAHGDSPN
jgi:hypothetical protein